jgi:hypothetical protein
MRYVADLRFSGLSLGSIMIGPILQYTNARPMIPPSTLISSLNRVMAKRKRKYTVKLTRSNYTRHPQYLEPLATLVGPSSDF